MASIANMQLGTILFFTVLCPLIFADQASAAKPAPAQQSGYFQQLNRPMDLPGVPPFGGDSKFRFGLLRPNFDNRGGTSVALRYSTRNSAEDVLRFYYTALPQYRWKMGKASSQQLSAELNGNRLTVMIMPRSSKEFTTDYYLCCEMPRR
ncbi:MAG: hypothetical protein K2W82_02125 [Candidatus Obscuribacterales bacterium]|nr:hypothetical protein [Candidatus Obscuribacterales bacterium]